MDKENPLSIENIWKWFEKEFGEEAMNRYHGYETERLIIETRKRTVQAIIEEIKKISDRFQVKGNNIEDEHPNYPQTIKYKGVTYVMEGTHFASVGIEILNLASSIKKCFLEGVSRKEIKR